MGALIRGRAPIAVHTGELVLITESLTRRKAQAHVVDAQWAVSWFHRESPDFGLAHFPDEMGRCPNLHAGHALAACCKPALQAAWVDPARALRQE